MARKELDVGLRRMNVEFDVHNGTGEQIVVRWKPSFVHLHDNAGRTYHQSDEDSARYHETFQFTVEPGAYRTIRGSHTFGLSGATYTEFEGPIDPTVDYLIFTVDEIVGLSNLNWRYDLL